MPTRKRSSGSLGLQLKNLSPEGGQVAVEGTVNALIYQQSRQERSLWQRLFR